MSGSRCTAAVCPTTESRFSPAIAVTAPATATVDTSVRAITCPAGTSRTTTTTAVFDPAEEYNHAPTAPNATTRVSASAVQPGRRCRVGNATPSRSGRGGAGLHGGGGHQRFTAWICWTANADVAEVSSGGSPPVLPSLPVQVTRQRIVTVAVTDSLTCR